MAGNNIKIHTRAHTSQISVGECTQEWVCVCVRVCVIILQVFAFVCPCQVRTTLSRVVYEALLW